MWIVPCRSPEALPEWWQIHEDEETAGMNIHANSYIWQRTPRLGDLLLLQQHSILRNTMV